MAQRALLKIPNIFWRSLFSFHKDQGGVLVHLSTSIGVTGRMAIGQHQLFEFILWLYVLANTFPEESIYKNIMRDLESFMHHPRDK
jgi:hypothetical protein